MVGMVQAMMGYGAPALAVNVSDHTITGYQWAEPNDFPPPAIIYTNSMATIAVLNTGVLRGERSEPSGSGGLQDFTYTPYAGEWMTVGTASDYDVLATVISGVLASGTTGTWLNCGTTRTWTESHVGAGSETTVLRLDFRPAGGGSTLGTCTITLTAQR